MANVLIVYASRNGQTKKIAERIAETLDASGHQTRLLDAEGAKGDVDPRRFARVFVCAPIYAGGYPASIQRFVREQRAALESVRCAFCSVGLAVASRTTDGRAETLPLVERFLSKAGWQPAAVELIAGGLPYTRYNFITRFIMRRISRKAGGDTDTSRDFEYTDWGAVDRFARSFASAEEASAEERPAAGAAAQRMASNGRAALRA